MAKQVIQQDASASATSASRVFGALRRDILFGTFKPGTKLALNALCSRYDIGLIPVREALNRLAAERLIDQEDQRGFFVRSMSAGELEELTVTRCWINDIMVRETIANATPEWEEQLVLATHHLFRTERSSAADGGLSPEWETRHRHFHMMLVAGCRSQWMQEFHAYLFDHNEFYRHQYASAEFTVRRDVDAEHRGLFEAALARDVTALSEQLNEHVWRTTRILVGELTTPNRRVKTAS